MTIGSAITDVSNLLGQPSQAFIDQLQLASWKNVEFSVTASRAHLGRRYSVHDYPFRDEPWVEDIGLGRQLIHLTGFLVGDDVIAQSNRMAAVCKAKNESDTGGTLIHPIFGRLNLVLLDFVITHTLEGRYALLEFDFIASSARVYPVASAPAQTAGAAAVVDKSANDSYAARVIGALKHGAIVVRGVVATVQKYGSLIFRLTNDATSLIKTVQALPGQFGRFFAGASSTFYGLQTAATNRPTNVTELKAQGSQSRADVESAMATAQAGAAALSAISAPSFAAQVQAVTAALAAATVDPADQVRLFSTLAAFSPPIVAGTLASPAQQPTVDLWRRAALAALARATALYQPSSYDDAVNLKRAVVALLDDEIAIAGDQGEDDVFLAFRGLKTAVAADLTARGASLAPIVTVTLPAALPAPVVAMRLYGDASRADEITAASGSPHPAFLPTTFKALAK